MRQPKTTGDLTWYPHSNSTATSWRDTTWCTKDRADDLWVVEYFTRMPSHDTPTTGWYLCRSEAPPSERVYLARTLRPALLEAFGYIRHEAA